MKGLLTKNRKPFAFILLMCMLFTMTPIPAFAETGSSASLQMEKQDTSAQAQTPTPSATEYADMSGHWAASAVSKWSKLGVVKGDERGFRPDAPITRAEMAVILDNLMDYQVAAKNIFSDVDNNAWYADAILKANAAGILNGDGNGHANPSANISREQAAVMLARALGVDESLGKEASFKDAGNISSWAAKLVFAMEKDKYIGGTGDGFFLPKDDITRAQVVTMIDNAVAGYFTAAGTYTDNISPKNTGGNCTVIVKTSGVTIKGSKINGDLIIAEGVAQGEFTLDSTTVSGKMIARGGGEHSIQIINGAEVNGSVTVDKVGGKVRIVSNGKVIKELEADTQVILEGSFSNVSVAEGANVEVKGQIENITVQSKAEVNIAKDAKVGTLAVDKAAEGTKIQVSGTVTSLKTDAPKTDIIAAGTANISNMETSNTAAGTNLNIDKAATVSTFTNNTTVTSTGTGSPKEIKGDGKLEKPSAAAGGGGGAIGGGGAGGSGGGSPGGNPVNPGNNPGGNPDPQVPVADQIGLVKATDLTGPNNGNVRLLKADGQSKAYPMAKGIHTNWSTGQIVAYGLNGSGEIAAIDAINTAIAVNTGLTIQSKDVLTVNATSYSISSNVIVFTYKSTSSGAANCVYDVYDINNIYYGSALSSPSSIYLKSGKVAALLIPEASVKVLKPTGQKGISPTSSANNDGKITGVDNTMEYKLSSAAAYIPITGNVVTGLAAGTYNVRYSANGSHSAGPAVLVNVPEYVTVGQYGLVQTYDTVGTSAGNVRLMKADGNIITFSTDLKNWTGFANTVKNTYGERLIGYGLNKNGNVAETYPKFETGTNAPVWGDNDSDGWYSAYSGVAVMPSNTVLKNMTVVRNKADETSGTKSLVVDPNAVVFTYSTITANGTPEVNGVSAVSNIKKHATNQLTGQVEVLVRDGKVVALIVSAADCSE